MASAFSRACPLGSQQSRSNDARPAAYPAGDPHPPAWDWRHSCRLEFKTRSPSAVPERQLAEIVSAEIERIKTKKTSW